MAATRKPATKKRAAKAPGPPEAYIIFERAIIPEQNAALMTYVTAFIQQGGEACCSGDFIHGWRRSSGLRPLQHAVWIAGVRDDA